MDAARTLSRSMRISRVNRWLTSPAHAPPSGSMPRSDGLLRKKNTMMVMAVPQPMPRLQKAIRQS